MIYLDNSATTKVYDEVADLVRRMMVEDFGNPSSLHGLGVEAEKLLKEARKEVAASFYPEGEAERLSPSMEKSIVFTSGGTESDNMAILGAYSAGKRWSNRIITTTIEHPAVLETVRKLEKAGAEAVYIDVDEESKLDLDTLRQEAEKGAAVISVMAVNNETGAKMPLCLVDEIRKKAAEESSSGAPKIMLHSDAVQALGKEDIYNLPVDLISVSAHKVHGPKGVGALFIRDGIHIDEFMSGGGQEKGMRSGTENLPGICGFGKALSVMRKNKDLRAGILEINKAMRQGIIDEIPDVKINSPEDGTPAILNVSFLGTRGEVILHTLEQSGIYVSTGSACSSGRNAGKSGSHVLKAMGLKPDAIEGAIRFSFGALNTPDEVPFVIDKLKDAVSSFRRLGSFR